MIKIYLQRNRSQKQRANRSQKQRAKGQIHVMERNRKDEVDAGGGVAPSSLCGTQEAYSRDIRAQGDVCMKDKIKPLSMDLLLMASPWHMVDTSLLDSDSFLKSFFFFFLTKLSKRQK